MIKKDKNFGRLLMKIKSAYDQYTETLKGNISSMLTEREAKGTAQIEEMNQMKNQLATLQTENEELKKQISQMKADQVKTRADVGVQV